MSVISPPGSGAYEAPSQTIGGLLDREWNATVITKPTILSDQNSPNVVNKQEMKMVIELRDGNTSPNSNYTVLGYEITGQDEQVIITVYAPSQVKRKLIEREINRILQGFRPGRNGAFTPIKKSNNTDDSPILEYDEILPEFIAFDADVKGRERSNKSSAILTVITIVQNVP